MTSDAIPAAGDARRLLTETRDLARRVRVAQRVTWLPLLALSLVSFGAIFALRFGHQVLSNCHQVGDGQVCEVWFRDASIYWWVALILAYAVTVAGYLRVARARGVGGAPVARFAIAGLAMLVLFTLFHVIVGNVLPDPDPTKPLPWAVLALFRLTDFTGTIGLALLVLAWLERHPALLVFALAYLTVVVVPINFGWGEHWGSNWAFAPMLAIGGGVLLLGSAGFWFAQRRQRPR